MLLKNKQTTWEIWSAYILICDFADFVIQNAVSGFHCNNNQGTVYPVVIYLKKKNDELNTKVLLIISVCLSHNAVAVDEFRRITTNFIKNYPMMLQKLFTFLTEHVNNLKITQIL